MLPIWQAEFGLSYAAVGALRGVLAGTMAGFQIPSGMLSERLGTPLVLAGGTALAGLAYCFALFAGSFPALIAVLFLVGLGASTQHPLASSLVAHAFSGARSLKALGTYNFAGDLGKMAIPAAGALLVTMLPWRVTLALIGAVGLVVAVALLLLTPRYRAETAQTEGDEGGTRRRAGRLLCAALDRRDRLRRRALACSRSCHSCYRQGCIAPDHRLCTHDALRRWRRRQVRVRVDR